MDFGTELGKVRAHYEKQFTDQRSGRNPVHYHFADRLFRDQLDFFEQETSETAAENGGVHKPTQRDSAVAWRLGGIQQA